MGKFFQGLLSVVGLGGKTPQATAPVVSKAAEEEVKTDESNAKKARAALYATEGGAAGQDLNPNQVKKRDTLLGN